MARKFNATGRSSKQTFIMIRHDIFDSTAWQSLSPVARCVWLAVVRRYNGINNGNIPLSCLEAAKQLGVSKNTTNIAFRELVKAGFLEMTINSGFNMKVRRSRRWRLTHEAAENTKATNDWKKWPAK